MSSARQELLRLLATKSFRLGEFKLSSGGTSDYYMDCRTTTLDARGAQLTGQVFLKKFSKRGWRPQAIGGLTMGADPIVVAVAVTSGEDPRISGPQRREAARHRTADRRLSRKGRARRDRGRCLHHRRFHDSGDRSRARIWIRNRRRDVPGGARRGQGASECGEGRSARAVCFDLHRERTCAGNTCGTERM